MPNVFRLQVKIGGGGRTSSEIYATSASTLDAATAIAEAFCTARAALLGGNAVLLGYRLASRDQTTTLPTGILRARVKNLPGPYGSTTSRNESVTVGTVSMMTPLVTAGGSRSKLYLACPPAAVATDQFLLNSATPSNAALNVITDWRGNYAKFTAFLQGLGNLMSVLVNARPVTQYQIIGVTMGVLGPTNILISQVAGDVRSTFAVGVQAHIRNLRFLNTRRRPADRIYRVGLVNFVPDSDIAPAHTDISLMCSDPSLAGVKPCSYGTIERVGKVFDAVTAVGSADDLQLTSHRRGSAPFVPHRGTPRIRVSSPLLTLAAG